MSLASLIPEFFNLIRLGLIVLTKIVGLIAWLLVFLWKRYDDIKNHLITHKSQPNSEGIRLFLLALSCWGELKSISFVIIKR